MPALMVEEGTGVLSGMVTQSQEGGEEIFELGHCEKAETEVEVEYLRFVDMRTGHLFRISSNAISTSLSRF